MLKKIIMLTISVVLILSMLNSCGIVTSVIPNVFEKLSDEQLTDNYNDNDSYLENVIDDHVDDSTSEYDWIEEDSQAISESEDIEDQIDDNDDLQELEDTSDNGLPEFDRIIASSTLPPEGKYIYVVSNILSNDDTCWSEYADDAGVGEFIQLSDEDKQSVSGINIINGYARTEKTFNNNCRVKEMRFDFSDGTSITKTLADTMDMQNISFDKTIKTTFITMTIVSVYEGEKYEDTCITFVAPY